MCVWHCNSPHSLLHTLCATTRPTLSSGPRALLRKFVLLLADPEEQLEVAGANHMVDIQVSVLLEKLRDKVTHQQPCIKATTP